MRFEIGDMVCVVNTTSQFYGWRGEVYRVAGDKIWARIRSGNYESHVEFPASSLRKILEPVRA